MAAIDISNQTFGDLTVIKIAGRKIRTTLWLCRCICGNEKVIARDKIISGKTVSCGCKRYRKSQPAQTHGHSYTPEYVAWSGAKARCHNLTSSQYRYYGGRGIRMCQQWRHSFERFLADMGEKPSPSHCLARINGNGDYAPDNCRWELLSHQKTNRKASYVEFYGEKVTLSELCNRYGVSRILARSRIRNGWPVEDAVTIPVGASKRLNKHP